MKRWLALVLAAWLVGTAPVLAVDVDSGLAAAWQQASAHPGDLGSAVVAAALAFVGKPYRSGTLEANPGERELVVRFDAFDCWTLVEVATTIALNAVNNARPDEEAFSKRLRALRYRAGEQAGYGSRLHYFSEWLRQAAAAGLLTDITPTLPGAEADTRPIRYMSTHLGDYPSLADPGQLAAVRSAEVRLSGLPRYFIPKDRVAGVERLLREGDLIAITSAKPGLDIAHQGLAVRCAGRICLLHASSEFGRVMVSRVPLAEYLKRNRLHAGIVVARWHTG